MTETTVQGYQKVTKKWIGRHVVITGYVEMAEGPQFHIDSVRGK